MLLQGFKALRMSGEKRIEVATNDTAFVAVKQFAGAGSADDFISRVQL